MKNAKVPLKMLSEPFDDWVAIYNDDIKTIWEKEKGELRRVAMIYCAFENELNLLKNNLHKEVSELRLELNKRDHLLKCTKFVGLAQSEQFTDLPLFNKENASPISPSAVPLRKFNSNDAISSTDFFIESPKTSNFLLSPKKDNLDHVSTSPILNKNTFTRSKRKTSPRSFLMFPQVTEKKTPKTPNCDNSNIIECSMIEDTPDLKPLKRSKVTLTARRRNKSGMNRTKQETTLTQMFLQPRKKKEIDSNLPSMSINQMIQLINESESETDAELSDATVDLDIPQPTQESKSLDSFVKKYDKIPEKKEETPKYVYNEVVRGKERKKLKGWSCNECKNYYETLDLPPGELEKKKNECSRHRNRFKPREETYEGFWDLTFGPTPPTQDSKDSLIFNYKK